MQRQADDDRQGPGGGQHALDRQFQHIGQGGDDGDEEDHRAHQVLQQAPGMPHPLHHQGAQQHRQGPRAKQPPANFQAGGGQVQGHVVGPGRGLHRVHALVEQHQAVEGKDQHPYRQLPVVATAADQAPEQHIQEQQEQRGQQRMIAEQGRHRGTPA